jgi:hypothetical protein
MRKGNDPNSVGHIEEMNNEWKTLIDPNEVAAMESPAVASASVTGPQSPQAVRPAVAGAPTSMR